MIKRLLMLFIVLCFSSPVYGGGVMFSAGGVAAAAPAGGADIKVGTYTGNGTDDRSITGLGFDPEVVLIIGDNIGSGAWRTTAYTGDLSSAWFEEEAVAANKIQSFVTDGFQIGTDIDVNNNTDTYYYIAMADNSSSTVAVGTYTGNSVDDRDITGLGFDPDMVVIKSAGSVRTIFKTTEMVLEECIGWLAPLASANGRIQSLITGGFQVGTSSYVNTDTTVYYWFALKNTANKIETGTYVGDGLDNRNITGVGFIPDALITRESSTSAGVIKTDDMSGEGSLYATATIADNRIQALQSDGFQLGTSSFANESGFDYYFVGFKE